MLPILLEIVPFRSRRPNLSLRPVNRIKHVIDIQGGIVLNVKTAQTLIEASDTPTLAEKDEVQTGSKVNGIYLKVEVYATTAGALSNIYMYIIKNPGGNLVTPSPNSVGDDDNKRYVIHQEMVTVQKQVAGNPRTLFNGVIALPRGYRRFGPNDKLQIVLLAPGVNFDFCVQCHYKEFR